jgi:hypothetical protein
LWKDTVIDELRGRYNPITHALDDLPSAQEQVLVRDAERTSDEP